MQLKYRGHLKTSKTISWLITLGYSLSVDPSIRDLLQGDHPDIPGGIGGGQIIRGIVLILTPIYSFTFTSVFMQ